MTQPRIPEPIVEASPACKLLFRELASADEPVPFGVLVERTTLARSTVRENLRLLEAEGLVEQRASDEDEREVPYCLAQ